MKRERYFYTLLFLCLVMVPVFVEKQYVIHILVMSSIMSVVAISWNLLSGYTGIFSFGHPAFFGLGAYASALLSIHVGVSPWITIFAGAICAVLFSFVIALPTLRLSGAYVAVVTLAFMLILGHVCYNWESLTNGPTGLTGIPTFTSFKLFGILINFDGVTRVPFYYTILIILGTTIYATYRIINSPFGLHIMAIRERPEAAAAMGVKITSNKIAVFTISSFFAGLAGAFYAHYILLLTPEVFGFHMMANILASTLIGGWGTLLGPALGAFILSFLTNYLKDLGDIHQFFYGAFLILIIFFLPKGLSESVQRLNSLFPRKFQ